MTAQKVDVKKFLHLPDDASDVVVIRATSRFISGLFDRFHDTITTRNVEGLEDLLAGRIEKQNADAYDKGREAGYDEGYDEGHERGLAKGRDEGDADVIDALCKKYECDNPWRLVETIEDALDKAFDDGVEHAQKRLDGKMA